eukprot:TRINITY_DN13039_c0_g1_i1.p1 TRINITY_DN13039_c0_g1~~TRINITY_DN13039_c0_g1_i1.p1  ORF type:complete len:441 (-),score=97.10 TRINITY_DN13039_c0_g1_i1:82-1383(-)
MASEAPTWTIIHGVKYDLSKFVDKHPGGRTLLNLAVQRDASVLFDSHHINRAKAELLLKTLPVIAEVPSDAFPAPSKSTLYNTICERVRKEVLQGRSSRGGLWPHILLVLASGVAVWFAHTYTDSLLAAVAAGVVLAWFGLTLNHAGNHGALTHSATLNTFFGLADDFIGGSSLVWRYHHQVSHHVYTNDAALDMDVFSSFPILRLDAGQKRQWFHAYQHIYMLLLLPFLSWSIHMQDIQTMLTGEVNNVKLRGATRLEYGLAWLGKALHLLFWLVAPLYAQGFSWGVLLRYFVLCCVGSFTLAAMFIVSHNIEETKDMPAAESASSAAAAAVGPARSKRAVKKFDLASDWAAIQIAHSANWGGAIGNFLTGGLNLQIEHHLFPSVAYVWYPQISTVVREECERIGVRYAEYGSLWSIMGATLAFLRKLGNTD